MIEKPGRAVKQVLAEAIPAIVRETRDDDLLRDALLENLHRSQLNPLEEAAAYRQLLDDFGCTHEELAGRSRYGLVVDVRSGVFIEDLSAALADLSPFHFLRVFRAVYVARNVRRAAEDPGLREYPQTPACTGTAPHSGHPSGVARRS